MPTSMPDWLTRAEEEHRLLRSEAAHTDRHRAQRHADRVNTFLDRLGIVPEQPATVGAIGHLVPAVLVSPDPENGYHGVHATFREDPDSPGGGDVVLLVVDHENPRTVRTGGILRTLADVAQARRELPKAPKPPAPNFKAMAERSAARLRVDYVSAETTTIAEAINGVTYALLHLAKVTGTLGGA